MQPVGRIETLDGLPILGVAGLDLSRKPHPIWAGLARTLPDETRVVFAPDFRTGWKLEGEVVNGCWIVLRKGSAHMPSWTSASGVAARSGTVACWKPFAVLRVPSEVMANDEPGRPYMLHRVADCQSAVRVLREYTAWRDRDMKKMRDIHMRASTAAKRRIVEAQNAEHRAMLEPVVAKAAEAYQAAYGTRLGAINKRLENRVVDAQQVETEARLQYATVSSEQNWARYLAKQAETKRAEHEARNG